MLGRFARQALDRQSRGALAHAAVFFLLFRHRLLERLAQRAFAGGSFPLALLVRFAAPGGNAAKQYDEEQAVSDCCHLFSPDRRLD